ncbi:MAG: endonuclease domain-containing protein [Eubacteriales bacterium]
MLEKNGTLKPYADKLRKEMTKEERHLWYDYLKTHRLRFNRQRIIGNYIVDFYCAKARLIIEIDGSQHCTQEAISYDQKRTRYFENEGLIVLRFSNIDVMRNFEGVCMAIELQLGKAPF